MCTNFFSIGYFSFYFIIENVSIPLFIIESLIIPLVLLGFQNELTINSNIVSTTLYHFYNLATGLNPADVNKLLNLTDSEKQLFLAPPFEVNNTIKGIQSLYFSLGFVGKNIARMAELSNETAQEYERGIKHVNLNVPLQDVLAINNFTLQQALATSSLRHLLGTFYPDIPDSSIQSIHGIAAESLGRLSELELNDTLQGGAVLDTSTIDIIIKFTLRKGMCHEIEMTSS